MESMTHHGPQCRVLIRGDSHPALHSRLRTCFLSKDLNVLVLRLHKAKTKAEAWLQYKTYVKLASL